MAPAACGARRRRQRHDRRQGHCRAPRDSVRRSRHSPRALGPRGAASRSRCRCPCDDCRSLPLRSWQRTHWCARSVHTTQYGSVSPHPCSHWYAARRCATPSTSSLRGLTQRMLRVHSSSYQPLCSARELTHTPAAPRACAAAPPQRVYPASWTRRTGQQKASCVLNRFVYSVLSSRARVRQR